MTTIEIDLSEKDTGRFWVTVTFPIFDSNPSAYVLFKNHLRADKLLTQMNDLLYDSEYNILTMITYGKYKTLCYSESQALECATLLKLAIQ